MKSNSSNWFFLLTPPLCFLSAFSTTSLKLLHLPLYAIQPKCFAPCCVSISIELWSTSNAAGVKVIVLYNTVMTLTLSSAYSVCLCVCVCVCVMRYLTFTWALNTHSPKTKKAEQMDIGQRTASSFMTDTRSQAH